MSARISPPSYRTTDRTLSILDEAGKLLNQHRALSHPCSTDTLTQRGSPSASEINTQQKKTQKPDTYTIYKKYIIRSFWYLHLLNKVTQVTEYLHTKVTIYGDALQFFLYFKKSWKSSHPIIKVGKEEQAIWEYWIRP